MENKKTEAQLLKEKLFMERKHGALLLSEAELSEVQSYCEGYKAFLDEAKSEREAVTRAIQMAEKAGFVPFVRGTAYQPGDKVYMNNRGKAIIFAVIGTEPVENGVNLMTAHIDSPRLDLKVNPLYEDNEIGYFKTHYYGGIKKYQWTAIPLSLHGVIIRADGSSVTVRVGEDDGDPVFCVTDLLPHLAADQVKLSLHEGIKGEQLNVLIGSHPFCDDEASERVKLNLMKTLFEKYGIVEKDFRAAELVAVPAFHAKDIGFDRSLIGAYGQDDRVCAYTAFSALLQAKTPRRTAVVVMADKEETGSEGTTGMSAAYLPNFLKDLAECFGQNGRVLMSNSKCLSADVNAAFDPNFPEVNEPRNTCYVNYGAVITKYTGARGKSGTSDASAEFAGEIQHLMDKNHVLWQTGELGKVDQGGGGTVAFCTAALDIDTIDIGVPVLSMHSPFEVTAKIDVYSTYRAFCAFIAS